MNSTRRRLIQAIALTPATCTFDAFAQAAWPEKLIRFVVGYPAGQSSDIMARAFAAVMGKDLNQTIIVDNRAGANGIVGAQEVKQSPPDGYSVLFGTSGQLTINPTLYRKLPYEPLKDFTPIGLIITGTLFLVAHPAFPANNLLPVTADEIAEAAYGAQPGLPLIPIRRHVQSTWMPARMAAFPNLLISVCINTPNSAGEL